MKILYHERHALPHISREAWARVRAIEYEGEGNVLDAVVIEFQVSHHDYTELEQHDRILCDFREPDYRIIRRAINIMDEFMMSQPESELS